MAPTLDLEKRFGTCYGSNCYSSWHWWGRWVLLGIIIFVLVIFIFGTCFKSRQRVRKGQQPIYGTGWMVPPNYYQSQQQYNQPAPPYNPQPGQMDAGYYDQNGNFVSHYGQPQQPPQPQQQPYDQYGAGYGQASPPPGAPEYDNYAPPSHPPPAHVNQYSNDQAAGQNNVYEMSNYPPPNYPPPKN